MRLGGMIMFCSNCGHEIADDSNFCCNCGFQINRSGNQDINNIVSTIVNKYPNDKVAAIKEYRGITHCTLVEATNIFDQIYSGKKSIKDIKRFDGVYRYSIWHGKQEVYCPRCNSSNCGFFQQHIPEKTKVKYTANLNPLKPFTIANRKEKVIQKEQVLEKFICNDCGKIFQ